MQIKDIVVSLSIALITTWIIHYFFFSGTANEKADLSFDRSFIAPASVQIAQPLDFDVDFYDSKPTRDKQITTINTTYGAIDFSNDGAIIERMTFNRNLGGKEGIIETIRPSKNKESGGLLVALNGFGNTPYYYDLIECSKKEEINTLIYKGESQTATILKEFIVYNDKCKIDLKLTIEPKRKDLELCSRIFFPAPIISDPTITNEIRAVLYTENQKIDKKALKDLSLFGKENPSLFGLEDRYFVNVLFNDSQRFVKRAYFKLTGSDFADAVLQSLPIKDKKTWELSFYFGPKESRSLIDVDPKLENILDYGWFWFISKPLLYILNLLYSIFKNYGVAIIILTILIRLLLLPFTIKGESARRKNIEAQKKLKYIEQKYKDDPERLARERAEFAKKHGLGMLGCLPLIILQVPVFIGLSKVLATAIELYKAPFLWMTDLSSKDPYYILPIFVGIGFALQTTQTDDPKQSLSNILIALVIAAVTSNLSAGLSLYICVSTFLGFAQTYLQKVLKI